MKTIVSESYNLDLIFFINILTGNEFYINFHKDTFNEFYQLISDESKENINKMVELRGTPNIGARLSLLVSSVENFNNKNLVEILKNEKELKSSFERYTYYKSQKWNEDYKLARLAIPVIEEIENLKFHKYWINNRYPLISTVVSDIGKYINKFDMSRYINELIDFEEKDCNLWICSYVSPHGVKLCGNSFISDYSFSKETTISIAAHELFHTPYEKEIVRKEIDLLAGLDWVVSAFEKQDRNSAYITMDGFIEENIVEALGIYVVFRLGIEQEPYTYFKKHDGGSHVISPHLFKFILENHKDNQESFESYFKKFVMYLIYKDNQNTI